MAQNGLEAGGGGCGAKPRALTIRATLTGPGGEASVVVSVWFRGKGATTPHFVTAYPGGEK